MNQDHGSRVIKVGIYILLPLIVGTIVGIAYLLHGGITGKRGVVAPESESPLGDPSELPPGNWKPLSPRAVEGLRALGFTRGEEWALDHDNPRRLLVSTYHSPVKTIEEFPLFSMDKWEPGPRSWEVITVAAELAGEMEKALPMSGFNPKYLWPVFVYYRQFPIQFSVGGTEVLSSFDVYWWMHEGVPSYVGEWFLANLPYEPHSVYPWVAIYLSGVHVPEDALKAGMERELEVQRRLTAGLSDESVAFSYVAWVARVCRELYPESVWWRENPTIMAALESQDKHDGNLRKPSAR